MNVRNLSSFRARIRANHLAWLSLVLAAAFALFQLVNMEHEFPSEWPLKVSLGWLVASLGCAIADSLGEPE